MSTRVSYLYCTLLSHQLNTLRFKPHRYKENIGNRLKTIENHILYLNNFDDQFKPIQESNERVVEKMKDLCFRWDSARTK